MFSLKSKGKSTLRIIVSFVVVAFLSTSVVTPASYAQAVNLPKPGTMVMTSPAFTPAMLRGITIDSENPFRFDFIVDNGDTGLKGDALKAESEKLIKYFLASMTVPEKDLWVNLSPFEGERVINEEFAQTDMGRDFLAQDYMLKQLAASLIYPDDEKTGKPFWTKIHEEVYAKTGETEIDTFNKVWIMPEKSVVVENGATAMVVESHLKVMLEQDYLALQEENVDADVTASTEAFKEIVLPVIEKEVNEGANFAALRQVFNSLILAAWFKNTLKDSILTQAYADQSKIEGIDDVAETTKDEIYDQYMAAYKKGVYNMIREDFDEATQQLVPKKYFSGGITGNVAQSIEIGDKMMAGSLMRSVNDNEDRSLFGARTNLTLGDDNAIMTTAQYAVKKAPEYTSIIGPAQGTIIGKKLLPVREFAVPADWKDLKNEARFTNEVSQEMLDYLEGEGQMLTFAMTMRFFDGGGSSLDLALWKIMMSLKGRRSWNQVPSTVTMASKILANMEIKAGKRGSGTNYTSEVHGLKNWSRKSGEALEFNKHGHLIHKEKDYPTYILREIFGLDLDIDILLKNMPAIAAGGGMESSNAFTLALIMIGSMLSGVDLTLPEMIAMGVIIENDIGNNVTGGQGYAVAAKKKKDAPVARNYWIEDLKNPGLYSIVQKPLKTKSGKPIEEFLMKHGLLVQAGKQYEDGQEIVKRLAAMTNTMWQYSVEDAARSGHTLHLDKMQIVEDYANALESEDVNAVISSLRAKVEIRNELVTVFVNKLSDALESDNIEDEVYQQVFNEEHPWYDRFDMLREYIMEDLDGKNKGLNHEEVIDGIREMILYSYGKITELQKFADENVETYGKIVFFPGGAGGPSSVLGGFAEKGNDALKACLKDFDNIGAFDNERAVALMTGKLNGELKGYMPFDLSDEDGIQFGKGFQMLVKKFGVKLPEIPEEEEISTKDIGLRGLGTRFGGDKKLIVITEKQILEMNGELQQELYERVAAGTGIVILVDKNATAVADKLFSFSDLVQDQFEMVSVGSDPAVGLMNFLSDSEKVFALTGTREIAKEEILIATPDADPKSKYFSLPEKLEKLTDFSGDVFELVSFGDEQVRAQGFTSLSPVEKQGKNAAEQLVTVLSDKDNMMGARDTVGGIDFTSDLNMQVKRDEKGMPLPAFKQDAAILGVTGITPVIINVFEITPQQMPMLFGLKEEQEDADLASI